MRLIRLKAKTRLITEEELEINSQYDTGNISKDAKWGYRSTAIPVKEIYKVVAFSPDKSLVVLYNDEMIVVKEPFNDLYKRWIDIVEKKDNKPEDIYKDLEKESEEGEDKE